MADTNFELLVTPEELRTKSSEIATGLSNIKTMLDEIATLAANTNGYWISEGADYIRGKIAGTNIIRDKSLKRLNEHPTDLESIAGLYEVAETENDELADELPGDVLF